MRIHGVILDNDLVWMDEFQYTSATGVAERSIDGHMVVQIFQNVSGQPMTLSGDVNHGWQKRATVLALQALADEADQTLTVELADGRVFSAIFRVEDAPVVSFQPISVASAPDSDFWYYGTINLRIV